MSGAEPRAGVLMLNFGEPAQPEVPQVVAYLERIFSANARLDDLEDEAAIAERSRTLAERRAPGLIATYEQIGGSPLDRQAGEQAEAVEAELRARGLDATVTVGMQFTTPTIADAMASLRDRGVTRVVALPVYPLCGPSTTVAALSTARAAAEALDWAVDVREISGWHRHPSYERMRADAIRARAADSGLALDDPSVRVVFSAHGTPMRYVAEGSRYVEYVEEWCARQADALGLDRWTLGYQNHSNRRIEWTQPDVEAALADLEAISDVVVDPISFVHEQSETLAELDVDLAGEAEALGLRLHRVPIAHAHEGLIRAFADLVQIALGTPVEGVQWSGGCRCRPGADVCLNAPFLTPLDRIENT